MFDKILKHLQIYLVSATNNTSIQQASPIPRRESLHSTTHKVSNSFTFPELQYLEDFEIYNINELQNLPEGSTIQSNLLSTLEIPFQKEYYLLYMLCEHTSINHHYLHL